jgi:hypothetical protein
MNSELVLCEVLCQLKQYQHYCSMLTNAEWTYCILVSTRRASVFFGFIAFIQLHSLSST